MIALTDTHCHLNAPEFAGRVGEVIARAGAAGVGAMVVPGWDEESSRAALALSAAYPMLRAAAGLHPWFVREGFSLDWLRGMLDDPRLAALGEVGLDWEAEAPRELQLDAMRAQLALAHERDLPVLIHCRHGWDITLRVLREIPVRGVMHAFSASVEVLHECVNLGLFISFAGMVTRPNSRKAHAAAKAVPADRLLIETDSPYIALEGVSSGHVEPAHLPAVLHYLAELRGEDVEALAAQVAKNTQELFG